MLSTPALLAFLTQRAASTRSPLVGAIYDGLVARILRGDFDEEDS